MGRWDSPNIKFVKGTAWGCRFAFCFISMVFSYLELTVWMRNLALIIADCPSLSERSLSQSNNTKAGGSNLLLMLTLTNGYDSFKTTAVAPTPILLLVL